MNACGVEGVTFSGIRAGRTISGECYESSMFSLRNSDECVLVMCVCVIGCIPRGSYFLVDTGSNG